MKNNIKTDKNGTRFYQEENILLFECQYCGLWFESKRRFNQKYCCNSCRTMASKGREDGLSGTHKRDATSNTSLLHAIEELNSNVKQASHDSKMKGMDIEIKVLQMSEKMRTDRLIQVGTLISSLVTNFQVYKVNKTLKQETKEQQGDIKHALDLILQLAKENEEIKSLIDNNEKVKEIEKMFDELG